MERKIISSVLLALSILSSFDGGAQSRNRQKKASVIHDTVYVERQVTVEKTVEVEKIVEVPAKTAEVMTGIEVLAQNGFEGLKGKKVALMTNPSGIDRHLRSTIDILYRAPEVELVALLAPEHGVRGDVYAGGKLKDSVDETTGLPVYSVYGSTRKPTAAMLKGVDVVVYDIQDVGSRSYTFISSLGLLMRACAENGIEVMVLDRPDPLGGTKVEGCVVEPGFHSFVSEFSIPYVYGLTVGELATLLNEEGLNRGETGKDAPLKCRLTVVPMQGWKRGMTFAQTGLPWVLPSPNIPYPESAVGYPAAGMVGEFGYVNIGVGYTLPFGTFAAQWIDADALKKGLDALDIPGVEFRTIHYKPTSGADSGKLLHGVQYYVSDYDSVELTLIQFYVMQVLHKLYPSENPFTKGHNAMFDKVCGTDYVRKHFESSFEVKDILYYWHKDIDSFRELSRKYYLYD